jgi:hypothetical protein
MESDHAKNWLTPKQLSERYPAFTPTWIRNSLFRRRDNGLFIAVAKVGRRVLIDEDRFLEWVESQREVNGNDTND